MQFGQTEETGRRGASHSKTASPLRTALGIAVLVFGMGALTGWLITRARTPKPELPEVGPLLVAMKQIGQLHTISYQMKDVLRQQSQAEPSGWWGNVPGITELVHQATQNRALVTVEGTVEAGIDLTTLTERDILRTTKPDGTPLLRVTLPSATIFPPTVHLHVVENQPGLFWRDENIVTRAQEEAGRRFQLVADRDGIRKKAEENAVQVLQKTQGLLGNTAVEFLPPRS